MLNTLAYAQGGLALAVLAVCAQLFDAMCMSNLGATLSATSLLIIVGTIMQSSRQVGAVMCEMFQCAHACMQSVLQLAGYGTPSCSACALSEA